MGTEEEETSLTPEIVYGRILNDGSDGSDIEIANPVALKKSMSVGEKTRRAMALKLAGASYAAIATQLGTEEQCLDFIERMRWPEGVRCPICGCNNVSKFMVKESTRKVKRALKSPVSVTRDPSARTRTEARSPVPTTMRSGRRSASTSTPRPS